MRRALIVDPDAIAAKELADALACIGLDCTNAESAEDALRIIREGYEIIFIENMLPGVDGAELCASVREETDAPVIFHSIDGSEASKVAAFYAGADDYVTKPASMAEMRCRAKAAMRRACAPRHARRADSGRRMYTAARNMAAWG